MQLPNAGKGPQEEEAAYSEGPKKKTKLTSPPTEPKHSETWCEPKSSSWSDNETWGEPKSLSWSGGETWGEPKVSSWSEAWGSSQTWSSCQWGPPATGHW